jgi:hypothetical protein
VEGVCQVSRGRKARRKAVHFFSARDFFVHRGFLSGTAVAGPGNQGAMPGQIQTTGPEGKTTEAASKANHFVPTFEALEAREVASANPISQPALARSAA